MVTSANLEAEEVRGAVNGLFSGFLRTYFAWSLRAWGLVYIRPRLGEQISWGIQGVGGGGRAIRNLSFLEGPRVKEVVGPVSSERGSGACTLKWVRR